jgi:L-lactate dehydrogenase complex protein LldF
MLGSGLAEILYCVRCGACLNACPVYRQIGGHAYGGVYPGPVGSVVMPGLHGLEAWSELAQASSLCGACRDVCPVRIDLPSLLLEVRRRAAERHLAPWWVRAAMPAYAAVTTRPWLYRRAGAAAAWLARAVQREGWVRRLPGPLAAWTASRDFPAPAARSFVEQHHARRAARP